MMYLLPKFPKFVNMSCENYILYILWLYITPNIFFLIPIHEIAGIIHLIHGMVL